MNISKLSRPKAILIILLVSVFFSLGHASEGAYGADLLTVLAEETDKGASRHMYTEIYEKFFSPFKNDPIRICEIGIESGGSLRLWEAYFPNASIFGIDILDKSSLENKRIKTFIADQGDRKALQSFINKFGRDYDFILDDGGHLMNLQQISLGFLFKFVKPGGYYILEDIHTSLPQYYPGYGVSPDGKNTTLKMINDFIANGVIESEYLSPEEKKYLSNNIEYCGLFFRNNKAHSITCVFKKKK